MNRNNSNTRLHNLENPSIDYQTYKALIHPISDLISIIYDAGKNVLEYVDTQIRLEQSINGYSQQTLIIKDTALYDILIDCVKSYNLYKTNPSQYNSESWGGEYPLLPIENINNSKLQKRITDIFAFFSLYYNPEENTLALRNHYQIKFEEAVFNLCENLLYTPDDVGLSDNILKEIPDKLRDSEILDIVVYSSGENNQNNLRMFHLNNANNNNNYNNNNNNNMNVNNSRYNGLPNNTIHNMIVNYNTPLNTKNVKMCFDPLLANDKNILHEDAVLYILNKKNKIIRTICIDEDSYNGILVNKANLFYRCKPSVPQGALFISPSSVVPSRLRKIATDIVMYVYENQAKKIKLGRKYVFTPTQEKVGRIASYATVRGNSVVSAEHCQNNYENDFIYEIQEYIETTNELTITGGKRKVHKRVLKKTIRKKNRKGGYKATKKNLKYLRKYKQGKSIGFTMRSSLKAKGLIPRSNGTYRVSAKYKKN